MFLFVTTFPFMIMFRILEYRTVKRTAPSASPVCTWVGLHPTTEALDTMLQRSNVYMYRGCKLTGGVLSLLVCCSVAVPAALYTYQPCNCFNPFSRRRTGADGRRFAWRPPRAHIIFTGTKTRAHDA